MKRISKSDNTHEVAVAMSGGVDSSVTAALMVQKYGPENVFGVTMRLFCYGEGDVSEKSCCSLEAINDAKSVCDNLGIAHYTINMERDFENTVVENFISEYTLGHTPIPCVLCNSLVKFGSLLDRAQSLGARRIATGHYARIKKISNSKYQKPFFKLLKGQDKGKDQSYFLYGLNQSQLSKIEFPIGEIKKSEVRQIAKKMNLKTAEKKESQGICFITEERVSDWISRRVKPSPGKIVDKLGNVLGQHGGIIFFTIGQRKMIGGGHSEPMYVTGIDAKKNQVIIGTKEDLYKRELVCFGINWINDSKLPLNCTAKIRYNMNDEPCVVKSQVFNDESQIISKTNQNYLVTFQEPQRAITPGQSVVFYDKEVCLGGGIIIR